MKTARPRAAFFGTPDFAVPCLDAVNALCDVQAVVCQPDRPAGRNNKLKAPAVKVRALELELPVWQPRKVRTGDLAERLVALELDVAVVVAYGRILPTSVLDAPRLGCLNVHGSLLPRWRGAAPIQWAVASGDDESGVCLMQMDEGMDTGPVYSMIRTPIAEGETAGELFARLAPMGAEILRRDLLKVVAGELSAVAQDASKATAARILKKHDGLVTFDKPASEVASWVRGMHPWPGAFTYDGQRRIKLHAVDAVTPASSAAPGEIIEANKDRVRVACSEGALDLVEVQLDGKRRVAATQLVAGRQLTLGAQLGPKVEPSEDTSMETE